jgi:hypothetical protein
MRLSEKIKRAYKAEVRKAKEWCEQKNVMLKTYSEADEYDMCIISNSEYDLHESKNEIAEDNGSYFLNVEDYEKYTEEMG